MLGLSFLTTKVAIATAAVVTAGGLATAAIVPALASGTPAASAAAPASSTSASTAPSRTARRVARATRTLALALARDSVKQTGLTRHALVQDLLAGRSLSSIDGARAATVESDVLGRIQARLARAVTAHRLTQAQATTRLDAARTAIDRLMTANLSTYLHRHSPSTTSPASPAAVATGPATSA